MGSSLRHPCLRLGAQTGAQPRTCHDFPYELPCQDTRIALVFFLGTNRPAAKLLAVGLAALLVADAWHSVPPGAGPVRVGGIALVVVGGVLAILLIFRVLPEDPIPRTSTLMLAVLAVTL